MKRYAGSLALVVVSFFGLSILQVRAQVDHIVIAAGTPEDQALQAVTSEQDPQKKLALYEDFVKKFS